MRNRDYITIHKSGIEHCFVPHDIETDHFVTTIFQNWETETFEIFEQCKDPNGIAIDLGAWIGTTSIWLSKNFKHVVAVESDTTSLLCLKKNLHASLCDNVSICERPISQTCETVTFGPRGEKLNESISYIKRQQNSPADYTIKSITLKQLIYDVIYQNKNLADTPITFIKCDIEGGEENIIEDLLYFAYYENIKVYLSFHPEFFQKHTVTDFRYLFEFFTMRTIDGPVIDIEAYLREHPLGSLLFESTYQNTARTLIKKNLPVCIMAYNQFTYIHNMVEQLEQYTTDIIIIDNNSTFQPLLNYYDNDFKYTLLRQDKNYGNRIFLSSPVQRLTGDVYMLTDPDLEFNKNLPTTWISDLIEILDIYTADRVGFALDISGTDIRTDIRYSNQTIVEWESQFWKNKLPHPKYELYHAEIDTTLCIIHRKRTPGFHIRVAGAYTCRHLPWHKNYKDTLVSNESESYLNGNIVTNWF